MRWRVFRDFDESLVKSRMAGVRRDVETCRDLSASFLATLKTITGCYLYIACTGKNQHASVTCYVLQLEEAYEAAEVLRKAGGMAWQRLPSTARFLAGIQQQLRQVIRSSPSCGHLHCCNHRTLLAQLRVLWRDLCIAEQHVVPSVWHSQIN